MQVIEDKAVIARLKREHKTDAEIAEILSERDDSYFKIGRRQVGKDRNAVIASWQQSALSDMDAYIEEEITKLNKIERVAWEDYAMTREPTRATEVLERSRHTGEKEKLAYVEKETRTVNSPASPATALLKIILDCIDKRAKLRGLYKYQAEINIKQETTHHVKHYIGWSPEEWDKQLEDGVVEGEFERA